jgi:hypothetical protein
MTRRMNLTKSGGRIPKDITAGVKVGRGWCGKGTEEEHSRNTAHKSRRGFSEGEGPIAQGLMSPGSYLNFILHKMSILYLKLRE